MDACSTLLEQVEHWQGILPLWEFVSLWETAECTSLSQYDVLLAQICTRVT